MALASGTGTIFQAVIDAAFESDYPAEIVALVTDQPRCGAVGRARGAGIPVEVVEPAAFADKAQWDAELTERVRSYEPQWLLSLGFMRLFGPQLLAAFPQRVLNTHPSLLPAFPGVHPVADAVAYGVKVSGCTVHVVDEGVDTGPVIAQRSVPVAPEDTPDELHDRIKTVERQLIVEVIDKVATHGLAINGRKAIIP